VFSELLTGASQCSASTFQLPSSNFKKLDKEQGPLQQGFFTALTLDGRRYRQAFRMISQLLDDNVQQPATNGRGYYKHNNFAEGVLWVSRGSIVVAASEGLTFHISCN